MTRAAMLAEASSRAIAMGAPMIPPTLLMRMTIEKTGWPVIEIHDRPRPPYNGKSRSEILTAIREARTSRYWPGSAEWMAQRRGLHLPAPDPVEWWATAAYIDRAGRLARDHSCGAWQ